MVVDPFVFRRLVNRFPVSVEQGEHHYMAGFRRDYPIGRTARLRGKRSFQQLH